MSGCSMISDEAVFGGAALGLVVAVSVCTVVAGVVVLSKRKVSSASGDTKKQPYDEEDNGTVPLP